VICDESDEVSIRSHDPIRMDMLSTRWCSESCREDLGAKWKCVHYALWFLVHCLKECATVLLSTAFWMEVNQVCVEPEDWRLLSTTLNSLKDLLWMLGSPDDGARRATCLV